jgi:FkbM family methyltransferase
VILELGSLSGGRAIEIARAFPQTEVYAFDCNPDAVSRIERAVRGSQNIKVVSKAVWHEPGEMIFHQVVGGDAGMSSLFEVTAPHPLEYYEHTSISVDAVRLDDWCREHSVGTVGAVFAGVQGAELAALQGMGTLLDDVMVVQTEVQYEPIYGDAPLFSDVDAFFKDRGFLCLTRTEIDNGWWGDCIYVRRLVA